MQEKILEEKIMQDRKNGLPVLLGIAAMYAIAIMDAVISSIILDNHRRHSVHDLFYHHNGHLPPCHCSRLDPSLRP